MRSAMIISTDYTSPITVNGFSCRNCTDVARAEKNIDPADPTGGPFGANHGKTGKADASHKSVFDRRPLSDAEAAQVNGGNAAHKAMRGVGSYGAPAADKGCASI